MAIILFILALKIACHRAGLVHRAYVENVPHQPESTVTAQLIYIVNWIYGGFLGNAAAVSDAFKEDGVVQRLETESEDVDQKSKGTC